MLFHFMHSLKVIATVRPDKYIHIHTHKSHTYIPNSGDGETIQQDYRCLKNLIVISHQVQKKVDKCAQHHTSYSDSTNSFKLTT